MKKVIKIFTALLIVTNAFATDRIVQENGAAGTYPTISAAITAAVDGDRIIVYPKIGDNPFIENITINKSLEFATAEDGVRYKIQGNISLEASNNRVITIIGAHLVSGNIQGLTSGWRTNVNIMGCLLEGGNINFSNQYYVNVVSNILSNGNINISHGKVIGNEISNQINQIAIQNSTSISNDTVDIIANKTPRIMCSGNVFLNIQNNFIKALNPDSSNAFFSIYYFYSTTTNMMNIINNTIIVPYGTSSFSSERPKYFNLNAPARIKNNIIQVSSTTTSYNPNVFITAGSSSSYNFIINTVGQYNSLSSTDTIVASPMVDQTTGQLVQSSPAKNGADPSFEFYDLDLTRGDAGCYGGSYSLENYFPITGSSRIYNIDMPFGISTSGGPLNIKADGFDR
ncbi:hypothetical protein EZL74_05630 [Flavobacterium silvisoli]|uniref:Uncharacterized protein n=1 Tax=Flavobacterium silvisoli TaxID=2529433 RepID=A0A4Q9Z1A2_9FLAO|nr:hypothetical protein [Flavobacterium silvisoli]TBX69896.1 hypothetical protein EZL74_05630 [Flavobacterium silvisoli]